MAAVTTAHVHINLPGHHFGGDAPDVIIPLALPLDANMHEAYRALAKPENHGPHGVYLSMLTQGSGLVLPSRLVSSLEFDDSGVAVLEWNTGYAFQSEAERNLFLDEWTAACM